MPDFEEITLELSEDLAAAAVGKFRRHPDHDILLSVARERARSFVGQQHTRSHVVWCADRAAIDWIRSNGVLSRRRLEALRAGKLQKDDPALMLAHAGSLDEMANQVAEDMAGPSDVAERADLVDLLKACMCELSDRERDVLWSRADGVELKELAAKYGVSVQRVDQIYKSALAKLAELVHSRS